MVDITLNTQQIFAVTDLENWWNAQNNQTFEISGPPGSGKSVLIAFFINKIGLTYDEVAFCTFAGKAAARLQQIGIPAKTIHATIYKYKQKEVRDEHGHLIFKPNGKVKKEGVFELKPALNKKIQLIVLDEASMISAQLASDLLSFGLPVIALGDLNQLPPVFGDSYFLRNPDVTLTQIMRQEEGSPIVFLCQQLLEGKQLRTGVYGNSAVILKKDLTEYQFKHADIVLTGTNRLRYNINKYYREKLKGIKKLDYPHIGEKVVCRKNDWTQCLKGGIYLTNGTTGFVDYIDRGSYNGKTMKMNFRPDFTKKVFHNIEFDYKHLYSIPGTDETPSPFSIYYDKMEYAYAITTFSSQGSQWDNVVYLHEDFNNDPEFRKKLMYTAISRAVKSITVVL